MTPTKALVAFFSPHEAVHTSSLELGNKTPDRIINELSVKEKYTVITKDTDFYYSFLSSGKPYKLVLVKLGNMRLKALLAYFERNAENILGLLEKHSFLILEPERIRALN